MGSRGRFGDWKPTRQKPGPAETERRFRIPRGSADETWVTSFCERHGFTDAKLIAVHDNGNSTFKGDCGCEILHGSFFLTRDSGEIVSLKPRIQKSA